MGACCTKNERFDGFMVEEDDEEDHRHRRRKLHEVMRNDHDNNDEDTFAGEGGAIVRLNGFSKFTSMATRQGQKGINQDAMTVWEKFMGENDTLFCAVFDGHGPAGHKVARQVCDNLPLQLFSFYKKSSEIGDHETESDDDDDCNADANTDDRSSNPLWKTSFVRSFKKIDEELSADLNIDSYCSGTTAVAIVKQGDELVVANLGDSRAVLCTRGNQKQLLPLQLTVDLKPNLPNEADRIRKCKGRVFSLHGEQDVSRVWMPEENSPGLAMTRAFGDFCLKDCGLISTPHLSHRKLTDDDEFLVLATDGVWDVLTNDEVMKIVATARRRSVAARRLVDSAMRAWRTKHPSSRVDDCAAICLFLKPPPTPQPVGFVSDTNAGIGTASSEIGGESSVGGIEKTDVCEWTALDGASEANSMVNLPRYGKGISPKRSVKEFEDI